MRHVDIHAHYLRQLIEDFVVKIAYSRTNYHIYDIFMKPLLEAKFTKLWAMLGIKEVAIMGGCSKQVISPPESLEHCVDGRGCGY